MSAKHRVCWKDLEKAYACGWVDALGAGPFEVVGVVDHSASGLRAGLVLKTRLGDYEVSEVWLEPATGREPHVPRHQVRR